MTYTVWNLNEFVISENHIDINAINVDQCRLCQCNAGTEQLSPELCKRIQLCTRIKIRVAINAKILPRSICVSCRTIIDAFYTFQQQCIKINHQYKNLFKNAPTIKDTAHSASVIKNSNIVQENDTNTPGCKALVNNASDKLEDITKPLEIKHSEICSKRDFIKDRFQSKNKSYLCTVCGKSFSTLSIVKTHEKIHATVKEHVCLLCNIAFAQSCNLRTHIKKHHEGHRFCCDQCGKAYLSAVSLQRHALIHIGIKEFKCEKCAAAFYTRKELRKHNRYHEGDRRYLCEICYKTFVEKHHLKVHLRIHSGERPFVCEFSRCGKSFTESQALKRHKRTAHPS